MKYCVVCKDNEISMELKNKLIGKEVKAIDITFNQEKKEFEDCNILAKVIDFKDENTAIVEHPVFYSEELMKDCGIKLTFTFIELLLLDIPSSKILPRNENKDLLAKNTQAFTEAITNAYKALEHSTRLFYIYRHYGPLNKPLYGNTTS